MQPPDWDDLGRELRSWADAGRVAQFWWRDDDAGGAGPALTRLLDLAESTQTELALAVVPAWAGEDIATALRGSSHVVVLQHGSAHLDHAIPGARSVECGGARPLERVLAELRDGSARLQQLFGSAFAPILAPPWNRIDPVVVPRLAELGFAGLSAFGPRRRREALPGLITVNAHVDPLNWRGTTRFAGSGKVIGSIIGELRERRTEAGDRDEPVGILTHHRDHDRETWDFLAELLRVTRAHEACRWIGVGQALGARP